MAQYAVKDETTGSVETLAYLDKLAPNEFAPEVWMDWPGRTELLAGGPRLGAHADLPGTLNHFAPEIDRAAARPPRP